MSPEKASQVVMRLMSNITDVQLAMSCSAQPVKK